MPTTLVHGFVPALCATQSFPQLSRGEKFKLGAWMFVLGNAADLDVVPAALMPHHFALIHREWGHNVFSLTLLTILGVWVLQKWILPRRLSRAWAYGWAAPVVFSHAFLDAFGGPRSSGLPFLWPVNESVWRIPWELFPVVQMPKTGNPLWNMVTHPDYWTHTVFFEGSFIFLCVGLWSLAVKRSRRPRSAEHPTTA